MADLAGLLLVSWWAANINVGIMRNIVITITIIFVISIILDNLSTISFILKLENVKMLNFGVDKNSFNTIGDLSLKLTDWEILSLNKMTRMQD